MVDAVVDGASDSSSGGSGTSGDECRVCYDYVGNVKVVSYGVYGVKGAYKGSVYASG